MQKKYLEKKVFEKKKKKKKYWKNMLAEKSYKKILIKWDVMKGLSISLCL